jgi:hypothetical protein
MYLSQNRATELNMEGYKAPLAPCVYVPQPVEAEIETVDMGTGEDGDQDSTH